MSSAVRTSAIAIAATCTLAGLALCLLGGFAPYIGLGYANQFVLYRMVGLARRHAVELGFLGVLIGSGRVLALIMSSQTKARIVRMSWRTMLAVAQAVKVRISLARTREASSDAAVPGAMERSLQLSAMALAIATACMAAASLLWGFDVSDEGLYLYEMSEAQPAPRFFISPVAGAFGSIFQNNILCWRYIGLALLLIGVSLFARAIARLAERLRLMPVSSWRHMLLVCAASSGGLAFFAYGPPTFSYRLASSAGVLIACGGLIFSVLAERAWQSLAWNMVASFGLLITALSQPPALAPYAASLLVLAIMLLPVCGWRLVTRVGLWHAGLSAAMGSLLLLPASFRAAFAAVAAWLRISARSGHKPSVILRQHLDDLLSLPHSTFTLVWQALFVGAGVALLVYVIRLFFCRRASKFYAFEIAFWAYSVLPFFLVVRYLRYLPGAIVAARQCTEVDVIACQGPTPALTGRDFIEILAAQLVIVIALVVADRLMARQQRAASHRQKDWWLLILFLATTTLVSSFYTDVGWFYHAILSLAPLAVCMVLAFLLLPSRRLAIPRWPVLVALLGFQVVVAMAVFHNRVLFPHRQLGGPVAQTQPLSDPPILRGLRIAPRAYDWIIQTRTILRSGGFVPDRDLVVAPYNLAGFLVALDARALGTPWYERLPVDCVFLMADHQDVRRFGRIFMIADAVPSRSLVSCLAEKGVDLAQERKLGTVKIDPQRSLRIFVIPVAARLPS